MDLHAFPSPCYVLDEARFCANLHHLHALHKATAVDVLLSVKAFALGALFDEARTHLQGGAAASLNEARLCYEAFGKGAHTYAVAYREDEFQNILRYSQHITFNSISQWKRFSPAAQQKGHSCGIRLNPHSGASPAPLYNAAHPNCRLGVPPEKIHDIPKDIQGLHVHTLCEAYSQDLQNVLEAIEAQAAPLLARIRWLNLGGGHLITDDKYDRTHLKKLLMDFQKRYDLSLIIEPGSAVVWHAGGLIATVLDLIPHPEAPMAILDVSFTCHMPDCIEMPYRPRIQHASLNPKQHPYPYQMGGMSCLAADQLHTYSFAEPLHIGQRIFFEDMMHYTFVKSHHFNGIAHPSIGIWRSNKTPQLLRKFHYADYRLRLA